MESSLYSYYYLSTDSIAHKWCTRDIEAFLTGYGDFLKVDTHFEHQTVFCHIGIMDVKSHDSWNSADYHTQTANFLSITTSKCVPPVIQTFFRELEHFLGTPVREEPND